MPEGREYFLAVGEAVCEQSRGRIWSCRIPIFDEVPVADIFDEVDEELRAERLHRLFVRYGAWLAAAALAAIAATGGYEAWRYWRIRADRATAVIYLTAMQQAAQSRQGEKAANAADTDAAIAGFAKAAQQGSRSYRVLARLQEAALLADRGKLSEALTVWDQVAADSSADTALRDLASLLWVQHQLDSGDPAELKARLAPLASPLNTWHSLAQEAEALLLLRQGQKQEAKKLLQTLVEDPTVPAGVRNRASAVLGWLSE